MHAFISILFCIPVLALSWGSYSYFCMKVYILYFWCVKLACVVFARYKILDMLAV